MASQTASICFPESRSPGLGNWHRCQGQPLSGPAWPSRSSANIIDDESEADSVVERHEWVPAPGILAVDSHASDATDQADAPHVAVQVLVAHAQVAERGPSRDF
jgi:hypothetical protein